MYLYQAARRKQERKLKIITISCFIGILLFILEYGKIESSVGKKLSNDLYDDMVEFCVPLLGYYNSPASEKSVQDYILHYFFPILEHGQEKIHYQTNMESEFSYEMILALEAADENYIDETTGQMVGSTDSETLISELPDSWIDTDDGMLELIESESSHNSSHMGTQTEINESLDSNQEIDTDNASTSAIVDTTNKLQKQVTYSREKLTDFDYLIQNFYRVDKTTTINGSQLNATEMLNEDMKLTHDASSPQILIYHTHSQEGYADSIPGDVSTSVVGVGDYLTLLLQEQYDLNVIHHTGQYDIETRDDAYALAGPAVEKILADNPSIEVVIDLHRDGVGENTRLVTNIDGVDMAKLMFVNGLSCTTSVGEIGYLYNPNLADNLAFSFQNQLTMAEYYPGLSRGVYLKGYRYNLHYCPKSLLVEVGAQTNTVQEAMNAMVPLADVINKVVTKGVER